MLWKAGCGIHRRREPAWITRFAGGSPVGSSHYQEPLISVSLSGLGDQGAAQYAAKLGLQMPK